MLGSSHGGSYVTTPWTWGKTHGFDDHPCACPTCRLTRVVREANNALEALAEESTERDMAASHLRSEVEAALASRRPIRRRLRRALEQSHAVTVSDHKEGTPAVHAEVPVMSPRTGSEAR